MTAKQKISKSDFDTLKWIFKVCKNQIPMIAFIVFVNVVHGVTSVIFANFSKNVIDGATVYNDMNYIVKFAIALLGVVCLQMALSLLRTSLAERCRGSINILFRKHLLELITGKDYSKVIQYHSGDLQNRLFNDVNIVSDAVTNIVPNAVYLATKLISSLVYLVIIDKIFALVFLVGGICIFLITRSLRKTIKKLHKKVQETEGKTRSFIQEFLTNLLAVKAFSAEEKMLKQSDDLQEENFKAVIKRRNFSIFANTGLGAVFNVGSVFAIAFGAWRILEGVMTYGTVTAMIQLVNQVQSPFVSLSSIVPQYFTGIASAERLIELEKIPDEADINKKTFETEKLYGELKSISFDNISFKYDRDIILNSTSFTVNKGDFIAIMGISGIGKSTLLKLLLGVFTVQSGEIYLETEEGKIKIDKNTRKIFTYVPQGNMILSGTIRENLTFVNEDVTEQEIDEAIRISCAKKFIDELPLGLDTVIGEKGLGLSEGQVQRLAIARSILSKSPIILLDEATSALDDETEKQFLTNLKGMKNVTCIIVSHKKAALEICNRSIQIVDGKIVEGF